MARTIFVTHREPINTEAKTISAHELSIVGEPYHMPRLALCYFIIPTAVICSEKRGDYSYSLVGVN